MPPRAFTNPAPKTESARSALTSFTCTLCSKSYSRHPEYEAHIGSYDHQHRKRLQDLKQLSRDPNAAEKARKAERRADAEAGLKKIDPETLADTTAAGGATGGGKPEGKAGGGGFKKSGFKSSFASVKAPAGGPVRKNVLGDEEEDEKAGDGNGNGNRVGKAAGSGSGSGNGSGSAGGPGEKVKSLVDVESETDEDIQGEGYYNPRKPTGCLDGCVGRAVRV